MSGVFEIVAKDVVMDGALYTIHGYENSYGEILADAVSWRNGKDNEVKDRKLRKDLINKIKE
jgi:DUF2075 family protein